MWDSIKGLVAEIKNCEAAGATCAALALAYVSIDTMAFLAMPEGKASQTREDFIEWVRQRLENLR